MRWPPVEGRRGPPRTQDGPPISQGNTRTEVDIEQVTGRAQGVRPKLKLNWPVSAESREKIEAALLGSKPRQPSPPPSPPALVEKLEKPCARISPQARSCRIKACLADLRVRFPGAFRPDDDLGPWPPFIIGLAKVVREQAPHHSATLLKLAITRYCRDWRYRAGHVEGALRVNLDGEVGEAITPEEQVRYMEGGARS
jgi:hypothetical protein